MAEITVSPVVAALTVTPDMDRVGYCCEDCVGSCDCMTPRVLSWVYVPTLPKIGTKFLMGWTGEGLPYHDESWRDLAAGDSVVIRADTGDGTGQPATYGHRDGRLIPLRFGVAVGTATITDILPVRSAHPAAPMVGDYAVAFDFSGVVQAWVGGEVTDLSHLLPFFPGLEPGGFLLALSDVKEAS